MCRWNRKTPFKMEIDLMIESDASLMVWGAACQGEITWYTCKESLYKYTHICVYLYKLCFSQYIMNNKSKQLVVCIMVALFHYTVVDGGF